VAAAGALLALVILPAAVVMGRKAFDREPVVAGFAPRYADMTEYYTTLNAPSAAGSPRARRSSWRASTRCGSTPRPGRR
jgi:hypothetical protein